MAAVESSTKPSKASNVLSTRDEEKTSCFAVPGRDVPRRTRNVARKVINGDETGERGPGREQDEEEDTVAECVDASHSPIRKVFHGVSRFMSAT